ncbi:LysM domain-containing protein [Chaetomium fimeti]|uniref:LysM domain-containing protein n=1 Tax=Chaetomium fimeti TaxID=1854472 RepID=A0AAE0LSF1_9PEZI|nr:LysM domain-containing protein [Chaetomium fimeti]
MFGPTPLIALLYGLYVANAQQFQDRVFPYESLGLSSKCLAAINCTVPSCPSWLVPHAGLEAASFNILAKAELQALCNRTCQDDLVRLRTKVLGACTASEDVMVPGGIAYPGRPRANYLSRHTAYSTLLTVAPTYCCRATGEYCDTIIAPWMDQTEPYTKAQNCSECRVAIQAKQLASPFGFDEEAASDFAFTTSSCSASTYSFARPTQYALNSTTQPPSKPTCTANRTYIIQAGDSCNGIAEARGVATEALINLNGLDLGCCGIPPTNTTICLPPPCRIRELGLSDTCESITAAENITISQLLAWNPVLSPGCGNLIRWRGRFICVSSPLGIINVPDGGAATTQAPVPNNTQGGSNTYCGQWHTIQPDDTCASISLAHGITLDDFYFLNHQVDNVSCSNLWLGYAYCVKAVGNIQTYPDYPVLMPSTTFTRPPPANTTAPPAFDPPPLSPRASGTIDGCDQYKNGWSERVTARDPDANTCMRWAMMADVLVAQLRRWNPSLNENGCVLLAEFSYCIVKADDMNGKWS